MQGLGALWTMGAGRAFIVGASPGLHPLDAAGSTSLSHLGRPEHLQMLPDVS